MSPLSVAHISTLHRPLDVRIFHKECRTLAEAGYDVHLVVGNAPTSSSQGITFHPIAVTGASRFRRMLRRIWQAYRQASIVDADIYHFHDPELILVGLLLKCRGAKILYDVHEDTPREALSLNKNRRTEGIAKYVVWELLEAVGRCFLDGFVCATPAIAARFPERKTVVVRNYPRLDEFTSSNTKISLPPYHERPNHVIYAGGITAIRGIREMVHAMEHLPESLKMKLLLIGSFIPPRLQEEVSSYPGWRRVDFLGWQPRDNLVRHLREVRIGLVLFHPERDHIKAMPNKLFEYMAADLPVIASNFPIWSEIIQGARCGLVVDPLDSKAIAEAIAYLLQNPEEAEKMGKQGRQAVETTYNWENEAPKLLGLYKRISCEAR